LDTGIDVSSAQGFPSWPSVRAAGIRFVYVKATEGVGWVSPTLEEQFRGAADAGLVTGLYHYARPDTNPAEADADTFASQVNAFSAAVPGHLPPCLDLEVGSGDLGGWARRFVDQLRARTGASLVMVYSGAYFFRDHIGEADMDPATLVWIAHYGVPPGQPAYLTPRVVMHQYASDGRVAGIGGNVDLNLALRPLSELTEAPAQPGGIETMGFNDHFTDWAGNDQTVQSWMNHLDQRLAELHSIFLAPGAEPSRIPGDPNRTNLRDMIMDAGAWTNLTMGVANRIEEQLNQQSTVDSQAVAAALGPVVRQAVTDATGEANTDLADAIVSRIGARLTQNPMPAGSP
jgi:lysozyme